MTRRATDRLLVSVLTATTGALVAVLAGLPEAAIFATPWAVLLVLGLSHSAPDRSKTTVEVAADRVLVGDDVEVMTTVTGASGSVYVRCEPAADFWSPGESDNRRAASLRDVVSGDRATIRCRLPATQWGVHDVGGVRIEVTEPYGLVRWEGDAGRSRKVRVHPRQTELQDMLAPRLVRQVTGTHSSRAVGRGVEFVDIRQYASGDSLREINWKVTARSPDLWVSQRHPDRASDVILLLDSFVESGHDVRIVVGLGIEAALALAGSHLAVADRVGLVELGGMVRWVQPGTGRLQLQRLTETVLSTGLHSHVAERDLHALMTQALPPRSFVVALSPLLDDRFIDALLILGGHGHDVAVIECDAVAGAAADSPTARLANRLWEADRQMVRDRLAERGIAVARWRRGDHLDLTLSELIRRRRGAVRASRR